MVRSPSSSCNKSGLKKGTWTPEEDGKLITYVTRYGGWNWRQLPRFAGLARCGKSCRLRWMNYLRPNIKRGNYTQQEEDIIIRLHQKLGNRWSAIAAHLSGRTDNEIKNHWHTTLKKRIIQVQKPVTNEHSKSFKSKGKDDESRQENSGPLSPQLSWSESSSITTGQSADASNENTIMEDDFAFLDAFTVTESAVSGNFWKDLYLNGISNAPIEIVPDSNGTNASFQSSDTASALSPQPSSCSDSLVLENGFAFLDAHTAPIIENFWAEPYVADVSHVPNELLTPMALLTESDCFSPLYDAGLWTTQSNLHDEPTSLF